MLATAAVWLAASAGAVLVAYAILTLIGLLPPLAEPKAGYVTPDFGSLAVAGATLLLAAFTAQLALSTSRSVDELREERRLTQKAVDASNRIASAAESESAAMREQVTATQVLAEEAIRDRNLRWEPLITVRLIRGANGWPHKVILENFGSGPAIDVVYVVQVTDNVGLKAWFLVGPVNLHGDESREADLECIYGIEQTSVETSDTTTFLGGVSQRRQYEVFIRAFDNSSLLPVLTNRPRTVIGQPFPPAVLFFRPGGPSGPVDGRLEACMCSCMNGHIHRALTHLRVPFEQFDPNDHDYVWLDWYQRIALSGLRCPGVPGKPDARFIRSEPL